MRTLKALAVLGLAAVCLCVQAACPPPAMTAPKFRAPLTREAQFVFGLNAPVPALAAQIEQESGWCPSVTAWDNGRGLAQFMDGTKDQVVKLFPELTSGADPYNPLWAIRALVRYDHWISQRMKGEDLCQLWGATLKGYNAGPGFPMQAQRASPRPGVWFGVTEHTPTKQSPRNFEYSRMYPRWILLKRQGHYRTWGNYICEGVS